VFDPVTANWSAISTSGFTPRSNMAVGVLNGKIYAAGGNNSSNTAVAALEVYDPAADSWTSAPSMTVALGPASGGVINGKFYVAGTSGGSASLQVFDGTNWSAVSAPAQALSDAAAGVLNNAQTYMLMIRSQIRGAIRPA
jgi:N-acetylneuraminic acid mutarotase